MSRRKLRSAYRKFIGRVVDWFEIAEYEDQCEDLAA